MLLWRFGRVGAAGSRIGLHRGRAFEEMRGPLHG